MQMIRVYYIDENGVATSVIGSYMDYSLNGDYAYVHDTDENVQKGSEVIILESSNIIRVDAVRFVEAEVIKDKIE